MDHFELDREELRRARIADGDPAALERFRALLTAGKPIVYGAIGGSITEGACASGPAARYVNQIANALCKYVPCKLVNAGIGASNSLYGAFRIREHLLKHQPDLITVEYAVNDPDDPKFAASFEAVVRQCVSLPNRPLVLLIFTLNLLGKNVQHLQIPVGRNYCLPMLSYRDLVWPEIEAGKFAWSDISPDTVHPNDCGHRIIADMVCDYLFPLPAGPALPSLLHPAAEQCLDGKILDAGNLFLTANEGWSIVDHRNGQPGFSAKTPGAMLAFDFVGTAITAGFRKYAGDYGIAEISIDGVAADELDGFFVLPDPHQTWLGGHTYLQAAATGLPRGNHHVEVRLTGKTHPQSHGHQFDLGFFLVK